MATPFTPEQISQILEEFFKVVGTRQYIGARYVPIFGRKGEESIEWDNSAPYEPLTIVLYQGNSYTSRQYVPAGVEITNQEFWAITGNYNAQIEAYRKEVRDILPYDETPTEGSTKGVTSDGIEKAIAAETTRARSAEEVNATAIANETKRAEEAEYTNATAIANEVTRAKGAEKTNADAIANEVTRAKTAEQVNADAITAETTRAMNAENSNYDAVINAQLGNPNYTLIGDYKHNNTNTLSTQCITPNITNDGFAIFGNINNNSSGFAYNAKLNNTIQYYAIANKGHYNDAATYNSKYYVISDFNNVLVLNADFVVERTIPLPTKAFSITRGFNNTGWILWTDVTTTSTTYTITDDNFNAIESHTIPCGGFTGNNPGQSLCVINDYLYIVYAKNIVKVDKNNNVVTVFTSKYLGGLELEGICYLNNITYAVFNVYGKGFCVAATSISQHATLPEELQFSMRENTGIYYNENSFNTWLTGLITSADYPFRNMETLNEVYKQRAITTWHLSSDITTNTIIPKNNLYIIGEQSKRNINGLSNATVALQNVCVYGDITNCHIFAGNNVTFGNATDNMHIWNTAIYISTTTVNIDFTNANIDSTFIYPNSPGREINLISNVSYASGDTINSPISNMVALYKIMAQNRSRLYAYLYNGTEYQCVPLYMSNYHTSTFFGSANLFNTDNIIRCNVVFSANRASITYTCSNTAYKLSSIVIG